MTVPVQTRPRALPVLTPDVDRLLAGLRRDRQPFDIVGMGELPIQPVYTDAWVYAALTDESTIPAKGRQYIRYVEGLGVPLAGIVIGHELPDPNRPATPSVKPETLTIIAKLAVVGVGAALLIGGVAWATMAASAALVVPAVVVPAAIDPCLCALVVDSSGRQPPTWVKFFSWLPS